MSSCWIDRASWHNNFYHPLKVWGVGGKNSFTRDCSESEGRQHYSSQTQQHHVDRRLLYSFQASPDFWTERTLKVITNVQWLCFSIKFRGRHCICLCQKNRPLVEVMDSFGVKSLVAISPMRQLATELTRFQINLSSCKHTQSNSTSLPSSPSKFPSKFPVNHNCNLNSCSWTLNVSWCSWFICNHSLLQLYLGSVQKIQSCSSQWLLTTALHVDDMHLGLNCKQKCTN